MKYDPKEYDPEESSGQSHVPGIYTYRVVNIGDRTFSTGSHGVGMELSVSMGASKVKVYANLVMVPKALWKVKEFTDSLGVEFDPPPSNDSLIGREGEAEFKLGEKGYLEVLKFLPRDEWVSGSIQPDLVERKTPAEINYNGKNYPQPPISRRVHHDDIPF